MQPWNEGKEAFKQGLSEDDNPYDDYYLSYNWDAGWCEASFVKDHPNDIGVDIEGTKRLYEQYLNSTNTYGVLVCDSCGWIYSHPINYCVKCPGKIVKTNLVILDEVKAYLKQNHIFSDYIYEFSKFYEQKTGTTFPYKFFEYPSKNYWDLTNVLYKMLGKPEVDIDLVEEYNDEVSRGAS